jgi:predicted O-linked N-acetylglucosamine transferase (SPINDLY family)
MSGDASDPMAVFRRAAEHLRTGRLDDAEAICRQILAHVPGQPDALHLLARVCLKRGDAQRAVQHLRQALKSAPDAPSLHFRLGRAYLAMTDLPRAEASLRRATKLRPDDAPTLISLGNLLQQKGETAEAEACYRRAVEKHPELPEAHFNLGVMRQIQGDGEDALHCFAEAIRLRPAFAAAHAAQARLLAQACRRAEAAAAWNTVLLLSPDDPTPRYELGLLAHMAGDHALAASQYREVLRRQPGHAAALYNLGNLVHHAQHQPKAAIRLYRQAIQAQPDWAEAQDSLGQAWEDLGETEQALAAYARALVLKPTSLEIRMRLARLRAALCDWHRRDADFAAMTDGLATYADDASTQTLLPLVAMNLFSFPPALHAAAARRHSAILAGRVADLRQRCEFRPSATLDGARIRLGYLSPDFRQHAVGTLIRDLFRLHDHARFEVHAYSLVDVDDGIRRAIAAGCDTFTDVSGMSPEAAARTIHARGIDVLIDLGGYTTYTRAEIPALRPAPVQVSWLGHLDTTGADAYDYIIADRTVLPDRLAATFSETPAYLPESFFIASPLAAAAAPPSRADCGLPENGFVFCCFNAGYKIDPPAFDAWMRILRETPESVLWLLDDTAGRGPAALRDEAKGRGIAPERLVFAGHAPFPEYLARHRCADLFLDTFAYNAGATAVGALWMGLPVLTLPGDTMLSRMGASLALAVGLPELACRNADDYVNQAISLAYNRELLSKLAARLRVPGGAKPLFDTVAKIRQVEAAFTQMHDRRRHGLPPAVIEVAAASRHGNPA